MKFTVIIPTKDRKAILEKTLGCIKSVNNIKDLEVVIVNDSDTNLDVDLSLFPTSFQMLQNPGSGVAAAKNFGASKAMNEWLIFMDDDILVKPSTFENLPAYYEHKNWCSNINWVYPDFIINQRNFNPFVRYLNKYQFDSLKGWSNNPDWNDHKIFRVQSVSSQFLVIHKSEFEAVGGYNERFPLAGFEDHDMSVRLDNLGAEMFLDPTNVVYHNEEDRIVLENWLERKRRGAITRKVAVDLGYDTLRLNYSGLKKAFYTIVFASRKYMLSVLNKWPQTKILDPVYFFLVNVLLGAYSYSGYTKEMSD
jgi:GT2 family glycosyltransferase